MRITTESVSESARSARNRTDEQKTSDRFSQLLKSKKEESQANQTANKEDKVDAHQTVGPATLDPLSANPLGADVGASFSQSSTTANAGKVAQSDASAASQIDKLGTEVSHQIEIVRQDGKAEAINITFDSKTLEGLQVQIRQQDGQLAIRFVTPSDNVSNLLSRHTGELQEALTSKGVKIRNIAISKSHTSTGMQRYRYVSA